MTAYVIVIAYSSIPACSSRAKLCDFGVSRAFEKNSIVTGNSKPVGTLCWICPEILRGESYNASADVYRYGVRPPLLLPILPSPVFSFSLGTTVVLVASLPLY
jgi:serine/threonine protein kinase